MVKEGNLMLMAESVRRTEKTVMKTVVPSVITVSFGPIGWCGGHVHNDSTLSNCVD